MAASQSDSALHEKWMTLALSLAATAEAAGEVPIGALVVRDDQILGQGYNHPIGANDPTAHAEIVALRDAARKAGNYRLTGSTLYVTLEPCAMCAGAIVHARVQQVVYGASDPRAGAGGSVFNVLDNAQLNHRVGIKSGVMRAQSAQLMQSFFKARR